VNFSSIIIQRVGSVAERAERVVNAANAVSMAYCFVGISFQKFFDGVSWKVDTPMHKFLRTMSNSCGWITRKADGAVMADVNKLLDKIC